MERLISALNDHPGRDGLDEGELPLPPLAPDLQKAAEDWAVFCLRVNKDALLARGLAISEAICQYVTELNKQ